MESDMMFENAEESQRRHSTSCSDEKEGKEEGNSDFGEPFVGQRILLDFKPNEEIDNEFVQKKCCEFWDFINSQPEFQMNASLEPFSNNVEPTRNIKRKSNTPIVKEKTAVSMLKNVGNKGIINQALESKLPTTYCKEELNDYFSEVSLTKIDKDGHISYDGNSRTKSHKVSSQSIERMCKQLESWDLKHPKCLDPPGPVPILEGDNLDFNTSGVNTKKRST